MTCEEIRKKYISFFCVKPRNHREISPSPLVIEGDPTTLFTSSGMQPLVTYLKGEEHPSGKRLVDCQPSIRAQGKNDDIVEVGDPRHLTYFEMLGNWSLGDYFKKEQLPWIWDFFTNELALPKDRLWVTVFAGNDTVSRDEESLAIWKKIGLPDDRIVFYPSEKNWWSRSGLPEDMPPGEIGGPDSEIFYDFGAGPGFHERSVWRKQSCHPNCDCGRFVEIGNSVFIQYIKDPSGKLIPLPRRNVDFGGGLERIAMAVNDTPDIFAIDVFQPVIRAIETETNLRYEKAAGKETDMRIIADHLRASVMLCAEGISPANKMQGYVLRKLLRRAIFHLHLLGVGMSGGALVHIAESLVHSGNKNLTDRWDDINKIISAEGVKFGDALERGLRKLTKIVQSGKKISGREAFDLYQTDGFPLELTLEILSKNGIDFGSESRQEFVDLKRKHREKSQTSTTGMFRGGLAEASNQVTKFHTATHLLHAALRKILGDTVAQKGSHITAERLRFDISFDRKLTDDEILRIEKAVNKIIDEKVPVTWQEMDLREAVSRGALHFFAEKYGQKVKVYTIGKKHRVFSCEICGGPHVANTAMVGHVKIIKQEKIGAGVLRLYAAGR